MSIRAKTIYDIPKNAFVILKPKSIHIPGDERSRTNPGHGYPATTESCWDIWIYNGFEEWRAAIGAMIKNGEKFVPLKGIQPLIETEVTTTIDGVELQKRKIMSDPKYPHIEVNLSGGNCNGNAFAVMGAVSKALQRGGVEKKERDAFFTEATQGDYDHVFQTCMKWVNVT